MSRPSTEKSVVPVASPKRAIKVYVPGRSELATYRPSWLMIPIVPKPSEKRTAAPAAGCPSNPRMVAETRAVAERVIVRSMPVRSSPRPSVTEVALDALVAAG